MVTLQSVQGHTDLTHLFNFLTFGYSGAQGWAPECPNVKKQKQKGGLDQYGAERFGRLILPQSQKWDWKG